MTNNRYLLSIIIPFYNRSHLIERVYNSLEKFDYKDVELILVDDGSTDDTYSALKRLNTFKYSNVIIIKQENKGPGGARNTGLDKSSGEYIWFVDSDDKTNSEVYWSLKSISKEFQSLDFIDYDIKNIKAGIVINSMDIEHGRHIVNYNTSLKLKINLGRLVTKVFKRSFFVDNNFLYPENCFYEDNFFIFVIPFYIKEFYKSDICGYIHNNEDNSSITRGSFTNRSFDRLLTAYYGFKKSIALSKSQEEIDVFWNRYVQLFLHNTLYMILIDIKKGNFKYFFSIKHVYDVFYNEFQDLENLASPYVLKDIKVRSKILKTLLVLLSISPKSKKRIEYFERINEKSWSNKMIIN